jgi:hypothetical protein
VEELDAACEHFLATQFGCKIDFYCEEVRGWVAVTLSSVAACAFVGGCFQQILATGKVATGW